MDEPQTWHYGLVARWWAEFNEPDPDELAFYQQVIEQAGQPALDLACGTGRLLLPLLAAGLDVDGCDGSADMLAYARERTRQEGFAPRLFQQSMHQLDLPRAYGAIFICDSFGIGASHEDDAEALKRCYRHLAPGGMLAFSHDLPYCDADNWPYWLPGSRGALPEPWQPIAERKTAKNGDQIGLTSRLVELDPLRQFVVSEIRAELWREDQLIREEAGAIRINLSFACELLQMLAAAGFVDAEVRSGYSERPATAEDTFVVFIARKGKGSD
jgi:SAM-dependent methyltransferase